MAGVLGIHHVTAIAGDPQRNVDFYAGVLGLRLVKRTVNYDDIRTYHLYYGDATGSPGSLLTFFAWPGGRRGRAGAGQAAAVGLAIPQGSIGFWLERLLTHGVRHEAPSARRMAGVTERVIAIRDPDGLMLELVGSEGAERRAPREAGTDVPTPHTIRGLHAVTLWQNDGAVAEPALESLGLRAVADSEGIRRYAAGEGGPGALVDVRTVGGFPDGVNGPGTVHHVAWRAPDDATELELRTRVERAGLEPTPVIDRTYFRSVYFREPGGVLFELATDGPGFLVDEPAEQLGRTLRLPERLEPVRKAIEAGLEPIELPGDARRGSAFASTAPSPDEGVDLFVHRYDSSTAEREPARSTTLLLLHGTGGDEHDLVPLGRALLPGAGTLSPRGRVSEHGAARFFRRLAPGVLDQEDLAVRTDELRRFVRAAAARYGFEPAQLVAVGFSNGANIASSLLLRYPGTIRRAILLSPMVPFEPSPLPDLGGSAIFIGAGRHDTVTTAEETEALAAMLRAAGASVAVHWTDAGHSVTATEVDAARRWLETTPGDAG